MMWLTKCDLGLWRQFVPVPRRTSCSLLICFFLCLSFVTAPSSRALADDGPQEVESQPVDVEDDAEIDVADGDDAESSDQADDETEPAQDDESGAARLFGRILLRAFGIMPDEEGSGTAQNQFASILGKEAPDFELKSADGKTVKLSGLRGQVVVLDFWASWCGPCRAAMPKVEQVHKQFAGEKVTVMGVNIGDDRDTVLDIVGDLELTFGQVLDVDDTLSEPYLVSAIPQTVLIDAKGTIQAVHRGNTPAIQDQLVHDIRELLAGRDLFDPAAVAEARAEIKETQTRVVNSLQLVNPERLKRGAELVIDPDADLVELDRESLKVTLPGDEAPSFAMLTPSLKLALARPGADRAEQIDLEIDDSISSRSLTPYVNGDQTHWIVLGAFYNEEDYSIEHMQAVMLNAQGKAEWTFEIESLENDTYVNANVAVGDVMGDETPEILVLTFHDSLGEVMETDAAAAARVLTILDPKGQTLVRAMVPGFGACGIEFLRRGDRRLILMATSEGITTFHVE